MQRLSHANFSTHWQFALSDIKSINMSRILVSYNHVISLLGHTPRIYGVVNALYVQTRLLYLLG